MSIKSGDMIQYNGLDIKVGKLLGEGGQGKVFLATFEGRKFALKWYHVPTTDIAKKNYLEQKIFLPSLIQMGPPNGDKRFLWPKMYVENEEGHYGYMMDLRPSRFVSIKDMVQAKPNATPPLRTFARVYATICMQIADAFQSLHASGHCYKDINDGGIFADLETGEVLICDNDNVRVDRTPGTLFMINFAAPEVILGKEPSSKFSDRYSLAIVFFLLWMKQNPLEGLRDSKFALINLDVQRKIFGEHPLFTFDPHSLKNRPDPHFHGPTEEYWNFLTKDLRDMFTHAFTKGIEEPRARNSGRKWSQVFLEIIDRLYQCPKCGHESIMCRDKFESAGKKLVCGFHQCNATCSVPNILKIGDYSIVLSPRTRLFAAHFSGNDISQVVAKVVENKRTGALGIRNLSETAWHFTRTDGSVIQLNPNKVISLDNYPKIQFSKAIGRMRFQK